MRPFLFAAGALALVTAAAAWAQDTNPARPAQPPAKAQPDRGKAARPAELQPDPKGNPWGTTTTRVTAARMASLEEEFETVEAHREVRRAYVKAAEVAVKAAETNLDLMGKAGANTVPLTELTRAKLEVEAARAQLDIRMAELKEVEVKVKYAKKRLDDAKAAGVRVPANPFPKVDPKPVDPPPPQ